MQRMFRRHASTTALATVALALIASGPRTMGAQAEPHAADSALHHASSDTSAVCLGFAFGRWTPPLDWHAAKHVGAMDSSAVGHAPGGRGWAAGDGEMPDSTMMLYPAWWPVGVTVALPTRAPAAGDTVSGTATALVADGRVRNPTAKVRAWRVRCGQPVATASPSREH